MHRRSPLPFVLLLSALASPCLAAIGPIDALGWTWADSDELLIDTSIETPSSLTPIATTLPDDGVFPVSLGFPFTLYGQTSSTVYFSTNGWISLRDPFGVSAPINTDLPDPSPPNATVAYLWDDHDGGMAGSFAQEGPTPNGHLFLIRHIAKGSANASQLYVQFYKNNSVKVLYVVPPDVSSATIGIESEFGGIGQRVAYNGAVSGGANLRDYAILFYKAQVPTCSIATPLACPGSINGSTSLGTNDVMSYACGTGTYSGKESVYAITLPRLSRVDLSLTGLGARTQHIFLLRSNCDSTVGCFDGGSTSLSFPILGPGTYWVVVDGRTALDDGPHTLTASCSAGDTPIACNSMIASATAGVSGIDSYGCLPGTFDGPEKVFSFTLTGPGTIAAELTPPGPRSLVLVDQATLSPIATPCIHGDASKVGMPILPPGDYALVVDGPAGSAGGFSLALDCRDVSPLTCNSVIADSLSGLSSIDDYGCFTADHLGPEKLWSFSLSTMLRVAARITPATPFDVLIASQATLLPATSPCLTGDDATATTVLGPDNYVVIVDGATGASGNYMVELDCEPMPTASFPLEVGEVVATCGLETPPIPGTAPFVLGVIDVRNPGCDVWARPGQNWPAPMYHNEMPNPTMNPADEWSEDNLGPVFGVALDDAAPPNIYAAATTAYGPITTPGGRVSRIDGQSGAITPFLDLPNTGPALGNIAFDRVSSQFFVTNHEDGKVYRVAASGSVLDAFDPFAPDDGTPGFAPLGERLWGVALWRNRVYFSVWAEDGGRQSATSANTIWSVGLDATGGFVPVDLTLEVTLPEYAAGIYSNPVSDIAFADDGRMMLAERTMRHDSRPGDHQSRLLEYAGGHLAWTPTPATFRLGIYGTGANSAGGVDYACSSPPACDTAPRVWATGDILATQPGRVYGMLGLPQAGGTEDDSWPVDFDLRFDLHSKGIIGDVEMYRSCCLAPPTASPGPTAAICAGGTVTLDGSGSSGCATGLEYRWRQAAVVACGWSPVSTCDVSPTATTTYELDVRCIGDAACTATDAVTALVEPRPTAQASGTNRVCAGSPTTLDGSGSSGCPGITEYRWLDGATPLCNWSTTSTCNVTPGAMTTYTLEVRCQGGMCPATTTYPVDVAPRPVARVSPDQNVCALAPVQLDASTSTTSGCPAGPLYEWWQGATLVRPASPVATYTPPTSVPGTLTYTVVVSCAGLTACDANATVDVTVRDCSLAVHFDTVSATRVDRGHVEVRWKTLSEVGAVLFAVERATSLAGPFTLVGTTPAQGSGASYAFLDELETASTALFYRVVEHTASGRGDHSPVVAAEALRGETGGSRTRSRGRR